MIITRISDLPLDDYTPSELRGIYLNEIKGRHTHDHLTAKIRKFARTHIM